jgi:hypothetical protein
MIEEPKKRLFAITITAARQRDDGTPEITMQNIVGLLIGDVDIAQVWQDHARQVFPAAERWADHKAIWTEIEPGMMFGSLRLTWDVQDTSVGAEQ